MRRLVVLFALISLPVLAREQEPQHTPVVVSREATQARLTQINELLSESIGGSKGATKKKLEKAREEVRKLLADLSEAPTSKVVEESARASFGMMGGIIKMGQKQMDEDRHHEHERTKVVVVQAPPPAQPAAPPAPPAPSSMSDGDFRKLASAVQRESFEDGKLQVIGTAAKAHHFKVDQVGQLLRQFAFSDGKLSVARMLKSRIVDPENNYQLYALFDFDNDKQELRAILGE